jgi:aminopeptidase
MENLMSLENEKKRYATLIAKHGLNVQEGQLVNISTEAYHRDFAILVAEACYEQGARLVNIDLSDPRLGRLRILQSKEEYLSYVPEYIGHKYRELVDETAANVKIIGPEYPDILTDLDAKRINTIRLHNHLAVKYFYEEGIGKSKVHWTVVAAATPAWGQKIFPNLNGPEAEQALWEQILKICRADQENCLDLWMTHNTVLQQRAKSLNKLKIKTLHFQGPGTDLKVGLSPKAIFKGGGDISPRGVEFEPNIPTEEVFTTPDYRKTEGKVVATRPFLINGTLIRGLELCFEGGKITSFKAEHGEETFREYLGSDDGAPRLGEVALVGIDSPIYQSGHIFEEILYDENAACHIAIGSAYKFCLDGGATMDKETLESIGCNESTVHTDMMISSEKVSVTAETFTGETVELIKDGSWVSL